jgi:hypothetical protein
MGGCFFSLLTFPTCQGGKSIRVGGVVVKGSIVCNQIIVLVAEVGGGVVVLGRTTLAGQGLFQRCLFGVPLRTVAGGGGRVVKSHVVVGDADL